LRFGAVNDTLAVFFSALIRLSFGPMARIWWLRTFVGSGAQVLAQQ
jgi:hypothetical protein